MTRRIALIHAATAAVTSCTPQKSTIRMSAPPATTSETTLPPGVHTIRVPNTREALLYIPEKHTTPVPLIVSLHGAGGAARHGIDYFRALADIHGFAILAPSSRDSTWDMIMGSVGPDVESLGYCLSWAAARLASDPARLAIGGFSDGASYALSLGAANGGIFRKLIAFSPGFMSAPDTTGKPDIFISHGTRDNVLPIDRCSRPIVQRLRKAKYSVDYHEFDGPHTIPKDLAAAAVGWWLHPSDGASRPRL